jgi:hypothetical protein
MFSPKLFISSALLPLCLALAGCGDADRDDGGGDGMDLPEDGSSPDSTDSDDTEEDGSSGGEPDDDGGTENDTGEDADPDTDPQQILARDVGISDMFVNQGVRIQIVDDGYMIPTAQRPTNIIAGRTALIRGYWDIPDDFEPRLIQGRLYVDTGSGEETMHSSVVRVEGESFDGDVGRSFWWILDGEDVTSSTGFRVELWEAKPGQEDEPEPDPPPVYPPDGTVSLGVSDQPMTMRVTLVRIAYNGRTPEFTEEHEEKFYRYMYEQNPLKNLELSVHPDVLSIPGTISDFSTVLGYVQDWHDREVGWDHYYFGVIDTGTADLGGAGGMAWSTVSAGLWWQNSGKFPFKTFVHEIGHNQGRPHTPGCEAAYPDYSYPDPEGKTQTWGYAVMTNELKHPNLNYDYMSYCDPQWVSEWTWIRTGEVIASMSGPPGGDMPRGQTGRVLIGFQDADGERRWRTASGVLWPDAMTEGETMEIVTQSGEVRKVAAQVQTLDNGTTLVIAPAPLEDVATLTWTGAHGVTQADL